MLDKFCKENKTSLAYRIMYRSNERTLLNDEINEKQERIRATLSENFDIILR
ncbi:phenylalanine--tRNA ligase subunit beta-related protein [Elizabethkingia miricola]|uniref:phenylalanine--tRNA ligase subunit beta-related protein n=1 Tax=Elizabethkingia miricola TaxID=172045 RepID=UPI00370973EE